MTAKQTHLIKSTWIINKTLNTILEENLFCGHRFVNPRHTTPLLISADTLIIHRLYELNNILKELNKLTTHDMPQSMAIRHYLVIAKALMRTLEKGFGRQCSMQVREACRKCYVKLLNTMQETGKSCVSCSN